MIIASPKAMVSSSEANAERGTHSPARARSAADPEPREEDDRDAAIEIHPQRQKQIAIAGQQVEDGAGDAGKRIDAGGMDAASLRESKGGQRARGFAPWCGPAAARLGRKAACAAIACALASRRSVASSICPSSRDTSSAFVSFAIRAAVTPVALILFRTAICVWWSDTSGVRVGLGFLSVVFDGRLPLPEPADGDQRGGQRAVLELRSVIARLDARRSPRPRGR